MAVDGCLRIVVLPVEPVILQNIDLLQTVAGCWPASRASREVPGIALRVEQMPRGILLVVALSIVAFSIRALSGLLRVFLRVLVKVDVRSIPLRMEHTYRIAVRPGHQD